MLNLAQLDGLSPAARHACERDILQVCATHKARDTSQTHYDQSLAAYDKIQHEMEGKTGQALAVAQGQLEIIGAMVDAYAAELAALEAA